MLNRDGYVTSWNRGAENLLRYKAEEILGKHTSVFYPPAERAIKPVRDLQEAQSTGRSEEEGWRQRKDGTTFWANVVLTPIYDEDKMLQGFALIARDFTERRRILDILRQSEERFRLLVASVKDYAIFMLDPNGIIVSWNEGAQRAKGYTAEEIIGKHISVFYTPEERARNRPTELLQAALRRGRVEAEGWRVRKDGTRFWADVVLTAIHDAQGQLRGFAKVTRDVTDRMTAEETIRSKQQQINELQKMEAVGRMAGAIAHDFNNLMGGIVGCADEIERLAGKDSAIGLEAAEVQKAADRASSLTRQLMAFSRRQVARPSRVHINHSIRDFQKMLTRMMGSDVKLELRLDSGNPSVFIDENQLQQIVLNLMLNARDAMPRGGIMLIQTSQTTLDEFSSSGEVQLKPGDYCVLTVSDTGVGMTQEVKRQIFEPFFTTKDVGKGTGLGLSTVYGIVKQNQGEVWVGSTPGIGSTFKIFFPAVPAEGEHPVHQPEEAIPRGQMGKGKTILVVEDEPLILRNAVRALQNQGYTVLSAGNAEEALEIFDKTARRVDLLLTDVIMPGINGKQLADKARAIDPNLKIVYMSGYSSNVLAEHGLMGADITLLEKPFSGKLLAETVRTILGAGESQ